MIAQTKNLLKNKKGFTLIETMIVIAIIAIMVSIAIPAFTLWIPNYRLKSAVQGLYSSLQSAKMVAIKTNGTSTIDFDVPNGTYTKADGTVINLNEVYKGSVSYGRPDAGVDVITYGPPRQVEFNARGMTDNPGWVYLKNNKDKYYRVGSYSSGVIMLKKWNGSNWE